VIVDPDNPAVDERRRGEGERFTQGFERTGKKEVIVRQKQEELPGRSLQESVPVPDHAQISVMTKNANASVSN
jgi:hypothetical protein